MDLGSVCVGWAYLVDGKLQSAGVWRIHAPRQQSWGVRWMVLAQRLHEVNTVSNLVIDLVAFEEVRNHSSKGRNGRMVFHVDAAHAYGGAMAYLTGWCASQGLDFVSVPVQDIKFAAVGRRGGRGTSKKEVLSAAVRKWPRHAFPTYDVADAAWICVAADSQYRHGGHI